MDPRAELLAFLDEHAFAPVLKTSPARVDRREEFEDAQTHTARARRQLHACATAVAVCDRFAAELHDEGARWVERELDRLGLPTLRRVSRAFGELCTRLGVAGSYKATSEKAVTLT